MQTIENYNNYHFYENFIMIVEIPPNKSNALSPDKLADVVRENLIATEINRSLAASDPNSPYNIYHKLIFSPEEDYITHPDQPYEAGFLGIRDDVIVNIDLVNVTEPSQSAYFSGTARVTIDVFVLREWLKSRNEIQCLNGNEYGPNGCAHFVPNGATHVAFGQVDPQRFETELKDTYGTEINVPAYERNTPCIRFDDINNLPGSKDYSKIENYQDIEHATLKTGVYLAIEETIGLAADLGFVLAQVLTGDEEGEDVYINQSFLKVVTWDDSGLNEEQQVLKDQLDKVIDFPVNDEPDSAEALYFSSGATHIVRKHLHPSMRDPSFTNLHFFPNKESRILTTINRDVAVRVTEQSIGENLNFHKVTLVDPASGQDINTSGYVYAPDLRPIKSAFLFGDWHYLPAVKTPDNKNPAGESPLLGKPWETLYPPFDGPWLKKDPEAFWNDMYQITVVEPIPKEDPRKTSPGSFTKKFSLSHRIKAVRLMMLYFDKRATADILDHALAMAKYGAVHEEFEFRKNVAKSLISVPARFIDALPKDNDDFEFDYEPNLEKIRENAEFELAFEVMAQEVAGIGDDDLDTLINSAISKDSKAKDPLSFRKEIKKYAGMIGELSKEKDPAKRTKLATTVEPRFRAAAAEVISGRINLNPSVDGEKVAFTTGLYLSDLEKNIKSMQDIVKHYEPKIKESGQIIKFPGFSAPFDSEDEQKKLSDWFGNMKELLRVNSIEFEERVGSSLGTAEENVPGSNNPGESWIELGWNKEFKLIYVLFNGFPLRIGFRFLKLTSPWKLARTNAFVHRSPDIVKEFSEEPSKRLPWSEWVKKNVYPVAVIEPSNLANTQNAKKKLSKDQAVQASKKSTAKSAEEVDQEEQALSSVDNSLQIQKEAIRKEIETNDATLRDIGELMKTAKDIKDIYNLIFNKLPFQSIAMDFLRCIGQDLDSDGLIELLIRLGLKEIIKATGGDEEDVEDAFETMDQILEILLITKDCALDILESGFEIVVEKPVVVPPVDEELGLPQIEGPYPIPGGGVNPTNPADPGNEGITHVVKQGGQESYAIAENPSDKKITFFKTLPWTAATGVTGYSPSGGEAYGRLEYGTAFAMVESDITADPNDEQYYGASTQLPPNLEMFSINFMKVRLMEQVADLPAGTIGFVDQSLLETIDAAVASALAEENKAIILKKGSKDGKNGLTNEVKSLQSYMGADVNEEQKNNEQGVAGSYIAGKYSGKDLIKNLNNTEGYKNISNTLTTEITNLDGVFGTRMQKLTKALGKAFLDEYAKLPPNSEKKPLISEFAAQKMFEKGEVTIGAMEKIKSIYITRNTLAQEKIRLDDIKKSLSFRSPSVVLGNVLFAPPGFYEGKNSPCNKLFIALVDKQTKYESTFIKFGEDGEETLKEKLELEDLFQEYRACMSANGTNVYGNYISHLFGKDIPIEEQKKQDGYKLVFAGSEGSECKELEDALVQTLGGTPEWPGESVATEEQKTAYNDWLNCVHKKSSEFIAREKEAEKQNVKQAVIQMHVSSRHPVPITFEDVYELFVNQKVGIGGIPNLRPKENAGELIADAILLPGRPCNDLQQTLIELLVDYIIDKHPEVELTVRYTLLAYKKSFEIYALVRSQMKRENPFGIPQFPKLPTDPSDKNMSKNFQRTLDRVLEEVMYTILSDLVAALVEVCKVMKEDAAETLDPDVVAGDILDKIKSNPESAQIANDLMDQLGIDVLPPTLNNDVLELNESDIVSELKNQPTIYAFLLAIIDGLDKSDICAIIDRSATDTMIETIKLTLTATFPEHQELISKDSTIFAIFDMISQIMPFDFCRQIFTPADQVGFTCLADLIDHNQRERFELSGLPEQDVNELIEVRKRRNMKRMVDVASLLVDPEGSVKDAIPDMCKEVKAEVLSEPGFMSAMNETVNSQLEMIKEIFNNDVTNFKPMIMRSQADLETFQSASILTENPFGMYNPAAPSNGDPTGPQAPMMNMDLLLADPETAILSLLEAGKANDEPDEYSKQVDKYTEYLETETRYGIFMPGATPPQMMTYGQLWKLANGPRQGGITLQRTVEEIYNWAWEPVQLGSSALTWEEITTIFIDGSGQNSSSGLNFNRYVLAETIYTQKQLVFKNIDNPNSAIKAISEKALELLIEVFNSNTGTTIDTVQDIYENRITEESRATTTDFQLQSLEVEKKFPEYNSVASENAGMAKNKKIMGTLNNTMMNPERESILSRPNVDDKQFKFSLNSLSRSGIGVYSGRQFPLVELVVPQTPQTKNNFVFYVTTEPPKLMLDGPVLNRQTNSEGTVTVTLADPPPSLILSEGKTSSYSTTVKEPLYTTNFLEMLEEFYPEGSTESGQVRTFIAFMRHTFKKHFPVLPEDSGADSVSELLSSYVGEDEFRALYMLMINSVFESSLKSIGKSKYFFEEEINSLNLSPSFEDRAFCEVPEINPSLHLLGIDDIKSYISNAFQHDFNPCETQNQNGQPETLEQAISEVSVMIFVRVTILETILNGIHAYGTFNVADLTKDEFIKNYMFDKCKLSLRQVGQYKAFKKTALKILERRRKQNKQVVPLKSGREALMELFKKEAETISPVYETMVGSNFKNFNDFVVEDLIFPVPVNMHSYLTPDTFLNKELFGASQRMSRRIGDALGNGINTAKIKNFFGVKKDKPGDATWPDLGTVEISPGNVVDVETLPDLTFLDVFKKRPGFIMERFVKLTPGSKFPALVGLTYLVNNYLENTPQFVLPALEPKKLLGPPAGPYISLNDFHIWLDSIKAAKSGLMYENSSLKAFITNLYEGSWDEYYSDISFGLRIKYILPDDEDAFKTYGDDRFPGMDDKIVFLKNSVKNFVNSYDDEVVPGSPSTYAVSGDNDTLKQNKFLKSSSVAFVSREPNAILGEGSRIHEFPLVEETMTVKLGGQQPITDFKSLVSLFDDQNVEIFYDTFFLPRLKSKIKNNNMFKSIFEYMLPGKKIINACAIYSRELMEAQYLTTDLFTSTKYAIATLHNMAVGGALNSGELSIGDIEVDQDELSLKDRIAKIMLGFVLKALLTAPPLIVKGVAEQADPNIMITKRIFDAADTAVKTTMSFIVDSLESARQEYMAIAKETNRAYKDAKKEQGEEIINDELPMPEYNTVREFMALELGINPPLDPSIGIPKIVAMGVAPGISLGMLPSMLPFGVGFPPPPFGPGVGPPMTPFAIPYLALGLIKEGGLLDGLGLEGKITRGKKDVCGNIVARRKDPGLEADDDPSILDYITDPGNQPVGPIDYTDIDAV